MKKIVTLFMCLTILFLLFPIIAYADIGPKESIVIDFKGLENKNYFVTLLSKDPPIGPHTAFNENSDSQVQDENSIRSKFVSYIDEDGYYFLQFYSDCSDTSRFTWRNFPPSTFKILIYFPDEDSFMVSNGVYEKYAFEQ
jgi:hypothetical protein